MEDRKGETYLKTKRKALPLQLKKKKCRFSFVFIVKKELRSSSLGHEVLSLEARERHSL